ncbi:MAG: MFS transporter [Pseudomonadota bacterium]
MTQIADSAHGAVPSTYDDGLAKRNAFVLSAASAVGGANASIMIGSAGLVGMMLAPDPGLATLPVTSFVVGTAAASAPAALLMKRVGRRDGFLLGATLGIVAGLVAAMALRSGTFALFCLAAFIAGAYGAFVQQYRFAAADTASPAFKPKAISWVLAGGVLAGVIGPQTVIHTQALDAAHPFAATYLAQGLLALVACGILLWLRVPPPKEEVVKDTGRPLGAIVRTPAFIVAALCGMAAYGLMSLVMTAAPIAMVGCGHSTTEALLGIQWHVIAMFGPSFFTGSLIARYGVERITGLGFILLGASAALALTGLELAQFWGALVLLGLGWNFGFIGATTMIARLHTPAEQGKVQALNELLVTGTVAVASLSSGLVLDAFGWAWINIAALPVVVLALAGLIWRRRSLVAAPA